jgi:glycosyltransferase involved in cell wall biosynthesis
MSSKITWNLLGLAENKTGIEEIAISYINLAQRRYPDILQKVYVSSGTKWLELISTSCMIIEVPRKRLDIGRPLVLGEVSHSWAKCVSKTDSRFGSSYTVHDWGPFFDNSMLIHQRILWASTIYRSIIRADSVHFLSKAFFDNAPHWAKLILEKKKIILSAPFVEKRFEPAGFQIPFKYVLAVGTNIPRKKFNELTRIWNACQITEIFGLKLLLVGAGTEILTQNGVTGRGYVSEKDLEGYLYNCFALISVSNYEGQNLPIKDALMLGKPVISTRMSSLAYSDGDIIKIDELNEKNLIESINTVMRYPKKTYLEFVDSSAVLIDLLVNR